LYILSVILSNRIRETLTPECGRYLTVCPPKGTEKKKAKSNHPFQGLACYLLKEKDVKILMMIGMDYLQIIHAFLNFSPMTCKSETLQQCRGLQ
jgi:hypothetical protein